MWNKLLLNSFVNFCYIYFIFLIFSNNVLRESFFLGSNLINNDLMLYGENERLIYRA